MARGPYHGIYINLERSPERRHRLESQLDAYGLRQRYTRFAAIDGAQMESHGPSMTPGEIAAFKSHHEALKLARAHGTSVHVLEDDALLSEYLGPVLETWDADGRLSRFDIVFTDMLVWPEVRWLRDLKQRYDAFAASSEPKSARFNLLNVSLFFFAGTVSYFVLAHAVDRVLAALEAELGRGPRLPIDFCIARHARAGKLRLGCVFPFITNMRFEEAFVSTIPERIYDNDSSMLLAWQLLKYSFFVNRDLAYAKPWLDRLRQANADRVREDVHQDLIHQALGWASWGGPHTSPDSGISSVRERSRRPGE